MAHLGRREGCPHGGAKSLQPGTFHCSGGDLLCPPLSRVDYDHIQPARRHFVYSAAMGFIHMEQPEHNLETRWPCLELHVKQDDAGSCIGAHQEGTCGSRAGVVRIERGPTAHLRHGTDLCGAHGPGLLCRWPPGRRNLLWACTAGAVSRSPLRRLGKRGDRHSNYDTLCNSATLPQDGVRPRPSTAICQKSK